MKYKSYIIIIIGAAYGALLGILGINVAMEPIKFFIAFALLMLPIWLNEKK